MESKCEYGCNYCFPTTNRSCTKTWFRSVKRKLDELELETQSFLIPGLPVPVPQVARVDIENECSALREMVSTQQNSINLLAVELEEERNASSSAANEAMSMILRLQREKASIEMEARQFKRFAEQKSSHDQQEIAALEELLYKREQTIQSLTCEVQAYKYRMMSYGLTEAEAEGVKGVITHSNSIGTNSDNQSFQFDDYPPLKCHTNEQQMYPEETETEIIDIDKYVFSETQTPCSIKDLEHRINQLERSPRHQPVLEKVIVGHSPRKQKPSTRFSSDSMGSFFATIKEEDSNLKRVENGSEFGSEMSGDRIYTVDSIHYNAPAPVPVPAPATYYNDQKANININNTYDDCISATKDSVFHNEINDPEVTKLYARLQALEADRESMRQAIINMRTDKAQLVLLKEIAQNLCKDHMSAASRMPAKKKSYFKTFGQTVVSFVLWRRNANQTKYMFGMTPSNPGLMVVLDKGSLVGQWRCVTRTQNTPFTKLMVKL